MNSVNIFYGSDGKLKPGWRFAVFAVPFIFFWFLSVAIALGILTLVSERRPATSATFLLVYYLVSLTAALVLGWLCGKYLENLPFAALGVSFESGWYRSVTLGLLGGSLTFAIAAGIGTAFRGLSFSFNESAEFAEIATTLLLSFAIFAVAAAFEEALFRGYILQTFVRSDLTLFGVLLTSTLFASIHNANPSATTLSWVNTFIAGVWFAVSYLKTRDLWLPIGLHLAWNWTQGSIFGVEVSGITEFVKAPVMQESDIGPTWLTGGDYGIEGGIVTTIALILSTVAIYFLPLGRADESVDVG